MGATFPGAFLHASCPVDEVIVSGRVENAPVKGSVRVQLVYPNHKAGDSAEATLDRGSFRIEIPFLTQSRAPVLMGTLREKCDRKPETVVVTLVEADQEYDRISLDLAKDFKKEDPSAYALRSEILLHGPPPIR
ncbi:MAG: hypothetical protein WCA49_22970 [Candidatus Sulfotelmatobacter sp.]